MEAKKFSSISLPILCFFVISNLLVLSLAVFGQNLSSTPTGSGDKSKIGVGPGHSSTAPSATGQSSPTKQYPSFSYNYRVVRSSTTVCNTSGSYSSCMTQNSPPTMSDMSGNSPPTMSNMSESSPPHMSDMSETSPPDMSNTNCSDYNDCTNGSIP